MFNTPRQVSYRAQDREWDARFNVQTDEALNNIIASIKRENDAGKFRYILIGGVEIGTKPFQDDYEVRHIHVAAILHNRTSKSALLKNWGVKAGNGYYLMPRNRDLPYSGWRDHHTKEFSKVNTNERIIFEAGDLPQDKGGAITKASEEEKKRKIDEIIVEIKSDIEGGREQEAFNKFPRNYLIYGERIKAMLDQTKPHAGNKGHPHIWLHGFAGEGKTQLLAYIYPAYYKKNLYNRFFDLYNPKVHTHVMLEDLDHDALDKLSINFVKTLCDEAGFAVDQKYKTPQITNTTVLVTSNFTIQDLIQDGPGVQENRRAFMRRFFHVKAGTMHQMLGLKLINWYDRNKLKSEGNMDPGRLFISWDYCRDCPTGEPIRSPEYYQQRIKDLYYNL
jgi:hypothetical protein